MAYILILASHMCLQTDTFIYSDSRAWWHPLVTLSVSAFSTCWEVSVCFLGGGFVVVGQYVCLFCR